MQTPGSNTGNRGQSPLPPPGPGDQNGNNLGQQTGFGTPQPLVPDNSGDPVSQSHPDTVVARPPGT
jgi:hypothetical protein